MNKVAAIDFRTYGIWQQFDVGGGRLRLEFHSICEWVSKAALKKNLIRMHNVWEEISNSPDANQTRARGPKSIGGNIKKCW